MVKPKRKKELATIPPAALADVPNYFLLTQFDFEELECGDEDEWMLSLFYGAALNGLDFPDEITWDDILKIGKQLDGLTQGVHQDYADFLPVFFRFAAPETSKKLPKEDVHRLLSCLGLCNTIRAYIAFKAGDITSGALFSNSASISLMEASRQMVIRHPEKVDAIPSLLRSKAGTKGGNQRNKPTNELKDAFFDFYKAHFDEINSQLQRKEKKIDWVDIIREVLNHSAFPEETKKKIAKRFSENRSNRNRVLKEMLKKRTGELPYFPFKNLA